MKKLIGLISLLISVAAQAASPTIVVNLHQFTWAYSGAGYAVHLSGRTGPLPLRLDATDANGVVTFTAVMPGEYFLQIDNVQLPVLNLDVPSSAATIDAASLIVPAWIPPAPSGDQAKAINLAAWSLLSPSTWGTALFQPLNANLTAWSGIATSTKQASSTNLTSWAALTPATKQDALTNTSNVTVSNLVSAGLVSATSGFKSGTQAGIAATLDILINDLTTNRLVFVGGILVSNIDHFFP